MQPTAIALRLLLPCCLLITAAQSLNAQPAQSAAVTQPIAQDPLAGDARLTQRVAIRAQGLPVTELLTLLSQKTGIVFTTQEDIGDEKVVLFSPARPLRATLADLAALFNNQWLHIEKEGERPRYKLIRTGVARAYEDSFMDGPKQRMMAQLEEQVRALEETPEQLRRRPADDIIRASLLSPERRLATQFYALLTPAQKDQLFTTGTMPSVPFAELTPAQQDALRDWCANHNELHQKVSVAEIEQSGVRFAATISSPSRADVRLWVGTSATLPMQQVHDNPPHPLPRHGNPYTLKPVPASTITPTAAQLARAATQMNWIDRLQRLAEVTGRPVLCDLFRTSSMNKPNLLDSLALPHVADNAPERDRLLLDGLCEPFHRLWWVRGNTLLLRTDTWYDQRGYEISDRWIRETDARIKAHGGIPTYGDLYRLLELTPKQVLALKILQGISPHGIYDPRGDEIHLQQAIQMVRTIRGGDDQPLTTTVFPHMVSTYVPPAGVVSNSQRDRDKVSYENLSEAARQTVQDYVKIVSSASLTALDKFQCYAYADLGSRFPPLTPAELSEANRQIRVIQDPHSTQEEKEEAEKQSRERLEKTFRQPEVPNESRIDFTVEWTVAPGHAIIRDGASYQDIHYATAIVTLKIPDDRSDRTRIDVAK